MSYGGSVSIPPLNHWTVLARCRAESIASGSMVFRRTQRSQRALSAFCFRRSSRFFGDTSSAPLCPMRNWWCTFVRIVRSGVCSYRRIPWVSLRFAFQRIR